ncbi:hypothetical protein V1389_16925, partial [Flavobacterium rakeshii]|uniref:hypothetical protein n=1 Tax=Flavobacterium rakeshii TaxID=1038845 RepID=UPI002E7ADF0D
MTVGVCHPDGMKDLIQNLKFIIYNNLVYYPFVLKQKNEKFKAKVSQAINYFFRLNHLNSALASNSRCFFTPLSLIYFTPFKPNAIC